MAGKLRLDTNAIIALFSGDKQVSARLAEAEAFVPSTALGELYYGAPKSSRSLQNVAKIEEFAAASQVIACDAVTAWIYGETKNRLHSKGRRFLKMISGSLQWQSNTALRSSLAITISMMLTIFDMKIGNCNREAKVQIRE